MQIDVITLFIQNFVVKPRMVNSWFEKFDLKKMITENWLKTRDVNKKIVKKQFVPYQKFWQIFLIHDFFLSFNDPKFSNTQIFFKKKKKMSKNFNLPLQNFPPLVRLVGIFQKLRANRAITNRFLLFGFSRRTSVTDDIIINKNGPGEHEVDYVSQTQIVRNLLILSII